MFASKLKIFFRVVNFYGSFHIVVIIDRFREKPLVLNNFHTIDKFLLKDKFIYKSVRIQT